MPAILKVMPLAKKQSRTIGPDFPSNTETLIILQQDAVNTSLCSDGARLLQWSAAS